MDAGAKMVGQLIPLAEAVMKPRGEAAVAETNAQVKMVELGNQLTIDLERVRNEGKSSERWFNASEMIVKAFGGHLGDLFSVFGPEFSSADLGGAAQSGEASGSPPPGPGNPSSGASSSTSNGATNGANGHTPGMPVKIGRAHV